ILFSCSTLSPPQKYTPFPYTTLFRSYIETFKIEQQKLSRNSNCHNFSHGCPNLGHNISRRSKLHNGSTREIRMVITFHTDVRFRSEEHTSELQSRFDLVCRLLLEKKN